MLGFIVSRLLQAIPVLLVVISVTFLPFHVDGYSSPC